MIVATPPPAGETTAPGDSLASRFAMGAVWSIAGAVVSRGLTLAASVEAGRWLGANDFGELGMIQSTQGLFGVLAGAGLGVAATKFVAEYRAVDLARAGRCIALTMLIAVVAGLAGAGVLFVLAGELAESVLQAPHLVYELQVATGLILFGAVNGVQTGVLAGLGDFRAIARLNILRAVVLFPALLIGIELGGVLGGVIGLVLTEVFAVVASQIVLNRGHPQRWSELFNHADAWRETVLLLRFSSLAIFASLVILLAMWYGNIVLATRPNGYAALGVFNAADRWRQVLLFVPTCFTPILLSMLSNLHGKNDPSLYRKLIGVNLGASVVLVALPAGLVMLLAPAAMSLFGAEYETGATTLVILAGSALAVVFNSSLGQVLVSKGAMGWRCSLDVLLAVVLAVASWLLIPLWHEQGLALAYLIAYSAATLGLVIPVVYYLRKEKQS